MSTVSRTILILNLLLTNIYALEADGQDGQLPAEILADIEAKSTPEECIPFDDCLPLTEFVKFNLKNIQNETITKSDLQSYVTELSCGVRELIWDNETKKYYKSPYMVKCPSIEGRDNQLTNYRTRAIITRGLYFFYPIFHCGLYLRAVYTAERLVIT